MVAMAHHLTRRPTYPTPSWRLVGPWYRWPRPALPEDGRVSRPSIQKFAGDDFIQAFLARPQHSLRYDAVIDVVNHYDLVSAVPGGSLAGKLGGLFALNGERKPAQPGEQPFRARLAPSSLRKLYQPAHDRHYLVTCELHCEEPGFPRVARHKVCQAGFVLRRRRSIVPAGITPAMIEAQVAPVRAAEAQMLELLTLAATLDEPASAALKTATRARQQALANKAEVADWAALLSLRNTQLASKRAALEAWYQSKGIGVQIEGWFPAMQDGRPSKLYGAWNALTEVQQLADAADTGELSYPLFPLVPDPRDAAHDAAGRTMYYGTVPTAGIEHDAQGLARFDDQSTYEVRCFVREHQPAPMRVGKKPDCCGPVVWSLATEAFRVAAPFDVLGTANRPITIKMPDLRELAAQAAMRPRGKLSAVRFVQPQHMSPKVSGNALNGGAMGGEAICSFSIPLITIIAMFVLSLFLPVVVFVFNLWFLLVFRFCIPPEIKFSADVDAALAATPPGVDLDADFAVAVGGVDQLASQLNALLGSSMKTRIREDTGSGDDPALGNFSNNALGPLDQSLQDAADLKADAAGKLPPPPPVGAPLVYEDPVTPVWPAAGAKP
uniref:hypothetical protein n=1 Tax=Cupriavidus yeoncheonensis TaxID=1462994 RepID=UPI003F49150D